MASGPRRGTAQERRKMERALRHTHSVAAGPSIIELLEDALTEACVQYRVLLAEDKEHSVRFEYRYRSNRTLEAQGRIRGLAISLAMMRHPLRRYETAWWGYVKKLEKRHLKKADELIASGEYADA